MKHKILMTLALLLTAVTGAWAISDPNSVYWDNQTWKGWTDSETTHTVGDITITCSGNAKAYESTASNEPLALQAGANDAITFTSNGKPFASVAIQTGGEVNVAGWTYNSSTWSYEWSGEPTTSVTLSGCDIKADVITFTFGTAEAPITVEPGEAANTWTFAMPGSDVVLTPIYAAATVYGSDGETEKQAYASLKEAFANVQDGDVIKLDWNVTLTEELSTSSDGDGVEFTIDFNGYTLDCTSAYLIVLNNAGDKLTFTDSSADQMGGLIAYGIGAEASAKFIIDAGRYYIWGSTAEQCNTSFASASSMNLAPGKEFVDLEGGALANDGFTLRVGYAAFELTIGAGKFATFYAEQNVTVVEGTNISFYTIDAVDQAHTTATVAQYNSPVVPGNFPILVYNGSDNDQNVKLKVTTDPSTITAKMQSGAFQGTADDREFTADDMAAKDYYVLSGGSAFAPVKGKGTIAAHKCWLEFAKQQTPGARQLNIVFDNDETTGVNEVIEVNEVSDDTLYDLNGRKLNAKPTRKGVYIQNGRKVVIK